MGRSRSGNWFRPWSKKVGRRLQTGPLRGIVGELVFYTALILLGVFVLALVLVTHVMVPRIGVELPPQARVVIDSQLASGGGQWGRWVVGVVSVAAIGSGCFGLGYRLLHLGFSQERIQSHKRLNQPIRKQIFDEAPNSPTTSSSGETSPSAPKQAGSFPELPGIPSGRSIGESPGERLQFRLGSESTGRLAIIGAASLSIIWNSVCLVLLAVVVSGWWYSSPRPILMLLLLPLSYAAVWALKSFLRQARQVAGVGPTVVEISEHPLEPGGQYEVFVQQMGRMRLKRFTVDLICEEESFFRQGTDVRSDQHAALSLRLLKLSSVRVDPRTPWEQQLTVDLPADVMHSFCATNNSVRWRLVVSGEARPWPSFCRSFPIVVHPPLMAPPSSPR